MKFTPIKTAAVMALLASTGSFAQTKAPEPDYTKLSNEELGWLREYYRHNKDYVFGVGKLKFNLWFPEIGSGA